jgi:hypothetical protein
VLLSALFVSRRVNVHLNLAHRRNGAYIEQQAGVHWSHERSWHLTLGCDKSKFDSGGNQEEIEFW